MTKRQLALIRIYRRLQNSWVKVALRRSRRYMSSISSNVIEAVMNGEDFDLIGFDEVAQGFMAGVYLESIETVLRNLVKKQIEPEKLITEIISPYLAFDRANPRVISYLERCGLELSKTVKESLKRECSDIIAQGYKEGWGYSKLRRELEGTLDGFSKTRLNMIMRSELVRGQNQGAMEGYRQSGIVHQVEFIATNDERTCEQCAELNGQVFNLESAPVPPVHPNCRCTIAPKF